MKPWSTSGVEGVYRFLARVWRLVMEENQAGEWVRATAVQDVPMEKAVAKVVHATIKKVNEDIEDLSFNTAISQMMVSQMLSSARPRRPLAAIRLLLEVLNPSRRTSPRNCTHPRGYDAPRRHAVAHLRSRAAH